MNDLEKIINHAFEDRDNINVNTAGDIRNAVDETLNKCYSLLDKNGFLVIAVPNINSFDSKHYKTQK